MRRLTLRREPLAEMSAAELSAVELAAVAGGITRPNCQGPTTLLPLPEPAPTFRCPPSGMC